MNRYEKTHRELKKQLEQLILSDQEHSLNSALRDKECPESVQTLDVVLNQESSSENEQN